MSVPVLFDRVVKTFAGARAVDQITLAVEPGELFFLLGPSGCGKTTLLRCLAGFYLPESGTLRIGNDDVTNLPPHRRDTGMVFQSYALWPHLTVTQNVAFGLEVRKVPSAEIKQRVAEALAIVKMTDRAEYKPNQLSGGQQQRVALARALVVRPKCLLLDEPLSNLDAKLRLEMRGEIRRICKHAGLTAIYVTHDQKEALSIADRMAILNRGRIEQVGRPQEVYLHPDNRFCAGFMGETNFIPGRVVQRSAEEVEVDTSLGRVTAANHLSAKLAVGDAVTLSLRPEAIHLEAPPTGARNIFNGGLHDTVYLGEMAQHLVNVGPNGQASLEPLKVLELNPRFGARDETTEPVKFWFKPEEVVVLTE